ncbi:MAG: succinate dehydrogenase [Planctomycetota bacterium]
MTSVSAPEARTGLGATYRTDLWWGKPLATFLGLTAFIVYSTWAAFQAEHYSFGAYLSPFYSPELFGDSPHAWFGPKPGWWPGFMPWSPAFLILWAPAGFRLTCYYYRGAYYKAFWADPPACAVSESRKSYRGEHSLPLILQNLHRYMLYIALLFIVFLSYDVWAALWFVDSPGADPVFGIGVGTLVLLLNVILLGGYTFGCHSFRHIVGGFMNRFSHAPVRFKAYSCVSCLNRKHQLFAWMSLFWVGFSDVYVRLCSMGTWTDWRIL